MADIEARVEPVIDAPKADDIDVAIKRRSPLWHAIIEFLVNAHVRYCYPGGSSDNCT